MQDLCIAMVQMNCRVAEKERNLDKIARFTEEAAARAFTEQVEETQLPGSCSAKQLTASFAAYQGSMARSFKGMTSDAPWYFTGSGLGA